MKLDRNPYVWYRVNTELFFGRDNILEATRRDLLAGRSVALIGGRKIGKTTLIRKLLERLNSEKISGVTTIPTYVDTLAVPSPFTQSAYYACLIEELDRALIGHGVEKKLSGYFDISPRSQAYLDFGAFRQGITRLLEHLRAAGSVLLVLLLDEIEPIVATDWGAGFFGNWRSLISNTPEISPFISVLFSGAKEMSTLSEDIGSPLANVLTSRSLEPLSWLALRQLIDDPTEYRIPIGVARQIFAITGGHPFLAQYVLHHVCEHDLNESKSRVAESVTRFLESEAGQFATWWRHHFSRDERTIYIHLKESESRVARSEVNAILGGNAGNNALETLCNFGVARKAGSEKFRLNGTLFRQWVDRFSSTEQGAALYDKNIYDTLLLIDPAIATKYVTAWSIYGAKLENYSGAVSEVRDVVTLILHVLAPDSEVGSQSWYKPEKDKNGHDLPTPTRRQRVEYIVRNRSQVKSLPDQFLLLETLVDQIGKNLTDAYSHASAKTHKTATRQQAWRCLKQLDSILAQVL